MKYEIFYSVQNGGDGSAYPQFMSSEKLAQWDQEQIPDSWSEPCTGSFEFESTDENIKFNITTPLDYLLCATEDEYCMHKEEFIKEFFPDGVPEVEVVVDYDKDNYYGVRVVGTDTFLNYEEFSYCRKVKGIVPKTEEKAQELQEKLNQRIRN